MEIQQDVFKYRKIVTNLYKITFWLLAFVCLVLVRINLVGVMDQSLHTAILKLLVSLTIPLGIMIRMKFILRPRIFSSYVLAEQKMLQRYKNKTKEIQFENIDKVKLSWLSPRFFGGFSIYLNTGQKFVFLSLLENNHLILDAILKKRPELLDADSFDKYKRMAQLVKFSWLTIPNRVRLWPAMVGKYFLYPLALAWMSHSQGSRLYEEIKTWENLLGIFLLISSFHFLFVLGINHMEEKWLNSMANEENGELAINPKMEKFVFILSQVAFYGLSFLSFYLAFFKGGGAAQ